MQHYTKPVHLCTKQTFRPKNRAGSYKCTTMRGKTVIPSRTPNISWFVGQSEQRLIPGRTLPEELGPAKPTPWRCSPVSKVFAILKVKKQNKKGLWKLNKTHLLRRVRSNDHPRVYQVPEVLKKQGKKRCTAWGEKVSIVIQNVFI